MDDKDNLPDYRKIKTGWAGLDEKTKTKLKNMGIHALGRTIGKLINPKGYIPGALGAFGSVSGKLSATGDLAEKLIGFRPKEGAIGIMLSRRRYVDANGKVKSGIFITSLMPRSKIPTEKQKSVWERTAILSKIGARHTKDIIHPIWEPLVIHKNRKPWTGYHYFLSLNHSALGPLVDWSKLLISKGKLTPPTQACPTCYRITENRIEIIHPLTINKPPLTESAYGRLGIGIIDIITGDFFHISPEQLDEHFKQTSAINPNAIPDQALKLTWKLNNVRKYYSPPPTQKKDWVPRQKSRFYIYNYYKKDKKYSDSISSRIRVRNTAWSHKIIGDSGILGRQYIVITVSSEQITENK